MGVAVEVVEAEIPLLIGGASLEKRGAILDLGKMNLRLPSTGGIKKDVVIPIIKEHSGHYSFIVSPPQENSNLTSQENSHSTPNETILFSIDIDEVCSGQWKPGEVSAVLEEVLITDMGYEDSNEVTIYVAEISTSMEAPELTRKDVIKLHHYFGHAPVKKIKQLIAKAGRLTSNVNGYLEDLSSCEICKVT